MARFFVDSDKPLTTDPVKIKQHNQPEVRCGMCARPVYVNEETYRFVTEAIKSGLDSPFLCEICEGEYDDLAYEG